MMLVMLMQNVNPIAVPEMSGDRTLVTVPACSEPVLVACPVESGGLLARTPLC